MCGDGTVVIVEHSDKGPAHGAFSGTYITNYDTQAAAQSQCQFEFLQAIMMLDRIEKKVRIR